MRACEYRIAPPPASEPGNLQFQVRISAIASNLYFFALVRKAHLPIHDRSAVRFKFRAFKHYVTAPGHGDEYCFELIPINISSGKQLLVQFPS